MIYVYINNNKNTIQICHEQYRNSNKTLPCCRNAHNAVKSQGDRLQIEDANLYTVRRSGLCLDTYRRPYSHCCRYSRRCHSGVLLINSLKFANRATTANKVNNVWQLSRLNDPPEMRLRHPASYVT